MKFALTFIMLAFASFSVASTTRLEASRDTYVLNQTPEQINGKQPHLLTGSSGFLLVNFDFSRIPKDAKISGVKIGFISNDASQNISTKLSSDDAFYRRHQLATAEVKDGWAEDKVSWPVNNKSLIAKHIEVSHDQIVFSEGGLIWAVQEMVKNGSGSFSYLVFNGPGDAKTFSFSSREGKSSPYAIVEYTSHSENMFRVKLFLGIVVSAVALLLVIIWLRRRKSKKE